MNEIGLSLYSVLKISEIVSILKANGLIDSDMFNVLTQYIDASRSAH